MNTNCNQQYTFEIHPNKAQSLFQRMPHFELSYEAIAHKKVLTSYDLALSIPNGKKFVAWFTFDDTIPSKDVCYLIELNRDKKMNKIFQTCIPFKHPLALGTILYGTLLNVKDNTYNISPNPITQDEILNERKCFVIEDIYYYQGILVQHNVFKERLGYIENVFQNITTHFTSNKGTVFSIPYMWANTHLNETDIMTFYDTFIKNHIIYPVHHIQVRKSGEIAPFLNIPLNGLMSKINKKETNSPSQLPYQPKIIMNIEIPKFQMDYSKPQYRYPTVFKVMADIQFDIYHLFVYGKKKETIYYDILCIPNYKMSVYMNSLFRKIRENQNIDYIEESEDEEDFENMAEDKYVDLNKVLNMECVFHHKFKKWVPVRVMDANVKIAHISLLTKYW